MSLLFQYKRTLKRQEKTDDFNAKCERSLTNKVLLHKNVTFETVRVHSHRTKAKKTKEKPTHIKNHLCFGSV